MSEGLYGYCECGRSKWDRGKYCWDCREKIEKQEHQKEIDKLLEERYPSNSGTSPCEKKQIDEVDLQWYERLADHYQFLFDERGRMSGAIKRLVKEIRKLKNPYDYNKFIGGWEKEHSSGHISLKKGIYTISFSKYGGQLRIFKMDGLLNSSIFETNIKVESNEDMMKRAISLGEDWINSNE